MLQKPNVPPNIKPPVEERSVSPEQMKLVIHDTVDKLIRQVNSLKSFTISLLDGIINEKNSNEKQTKQTTENQEVNPDGSQESKS